MSYEAEKRYTVTIESARLDRSPQGQLNVNVGMRGEGGAIWGTIWLESGDPAKTAKTAADARKTFAGFGYTDDAAISGLIKLGFAPLVGREATIKTYTTNGGKVAARYIDGPLAKPAEREVSRESIAAAVALFGGTLDEDEEIPF